MPTPLDRALNSKNLFLGFAGIITATAIYSIWGTDMFPKEEEVITDPKGEPETWTADQKRRWLKARGLETGTTATTPELIAMIRANMSAPKVK